VAPFIYYTDIIYFLRRKRKRFLACGEFWMQLLLRQKGRELMSDNQRGRPAKGGERATIRIENNTHQEIKVYCAANGLELSDFLGDAVAAWWKEQPARESARKSIEDMKSSAPKGKKTAQKNAAE
jgi:hypothetical protein